MSSVSPCCYKIFCLALLALSAVPLRAVTDEEFAGPFPSWTNVKVTYGAKGDGVTDDTSAIQKALNELQTQGHSSVLYFPAGTYRVTGLALRAKQGVSLIGADPATTILKYSGATSGTLLTVDGVSYSRFDRFTFDGGGTANTVVDQSWNCSTGNFDTGNQYADDTFQGGSIGLQGGNNNCGFAETTILRSKFIGLPTGVVLQNFNALDIWIWYSLFDHCGTGVTNYPGAGNFHVYNSVFRSSTVSDMAIANTGGFNIRNNYSSGSKAFWTSWSHYRYSAQVTLQGNTLVNTGNPAIDIGNQGPALLIDNRIQSTDTTPAVSALNSDTADIITVGNTFPAAGSVSVPSTARWTSADDTVATVTLSEPALPATPTSLNRTVVEVAAGATAADIQKAINSAAQLSHAIVHLPEGDYRIDTTLQIPANADLQLTGDGYFATRLTWTGADAGPVVRVSGPNRSVFRDFTISGGTNAADGIVIAGIDQQNSRIHLQQAQLTEARTSNLWADGLDYALVDLRNISHGASLSGASVKVSGGPLAAAGTPQSGRVDLFSGSSPDVLLDYDLSNGGSLLVRDIWYETSGTGSPSYAHVSGSGKFTLHGSRVAVAPNQSSTTPAVNVTDWHGIAALMNTLIDGRVISSGDGAGGRIFGLGLVNGVADANFFASQTNPSDSRWLWNSRIQTADAHSQQIPNQGAADAGSLRIALAQTRAEQPQWITDTPSGSSDVRLYRVWVRSANVGVHLSAATSSCSVKLSQSAITVPAIYGTGIIRVAAATGCPWTAQSNTAWLTITSGASGNRDGSVFYQIQPNTDTADRTGSLTIDSQTVSITQMSPLTPPVLSLTGPIPSMNSYAALTMAAGDNPQVIPVSLNANTVIADYTSTVNGTPKFLVALPNTGKTPLTINLWVYPAGLAPGMYTNTVTFSSAGSTVTYTVALVISSPSRTGAKVSIYRGAESLFLADYNGDGIYSTGDLGGTIGQAGDIPLAGDWSGTGKQRLGLYRPSTGLFLLDVDGSASFTAADKALTFSPQAGDVPVVGDWTGTGVERVGVFRNGTWYLDVNGDGTFAGRAYLGQSGDIPLAGNWNGVGTKSKVGIYRPNAVNGQPGNFFLIDSNGDGQYTSADLPLFFLGQQGDVPIVGDWSGDGKTKVGIFRPAGATSNAGLFILDYDGSYSWGGPGVDRVLFFAPMLTGPGTSTAIQAGDIPITGNWVPSYTPAAAGLAIGQGKTRTGIYRPSTGTFFLDATADGTFQGRAFLGQAGDVPVGVPAISAGAVVGVNMLGNF